MANLLQKASIVLTPTAYDNGKVLCAKPSEPPYGDFDFSRNSAATRVNAQGLVENVQILSSNLVQNGDFSEEGVQEVSNGSFSQEGSELVTNGDFSNGSTDWNLTRGNVINDKLVFNTTGQPSGSRSVFAIQTNVADLNKIYKVEFTISDYVSGQFRLRKPFITSDTFGNGTYTYYGTASEINFELQGRLDIEHNFSIDNVSVREVAQNWTLGTGWSIGEDKATFDETIGGAGDIVQNSILTSGKSYKLTFDTLETNGGNLAYKLGGGYTFISNIQANTTHTVCGVAGGSQFALRGASDFIGSITNISVKEVGQNWDILTEGWSIDQTNSKATCDGTQTATTSLKSSGIIGIQNELVSISFEVKDYSAGILSVTLEGTGGNDFPSITANGTYTKEVTSTDNLPKLLFNANTDFIGSVTNVKIIEITDDTNLPRINYEGFSYQDALGSELVTNGSFDNGSTDWYVPDGGWSVSNNTLISDGSTTAATALQNININGDVGTIYKLTLNVVSATNADLRFYSPNVGYISQIVNTGDALTYLLESNGSYSFLAARNYSGAEIILDNVSVKEYSGQEVVPDSGCGSWLFEPQSTNLFNYSEDLSNSYWSDFGTEVSRNLNASQINPSGTAGSYELEGVGGLRRFGIFLTVTPSTDYTLSFYAKNIDATLLKALFTNSSVTTYTYTSEVNTTDWSRVEINFTTLTGTSTSVQILRDLPIGESIYIWGLMLEQQTYATSYIPTEGSQTTRNSDLCTNGGSLASINSTEGVLYAEIAKQQDDNDSFILISLNNAASNGDDNSVTIGFNNSTKFYLRVKSNGIISFIDQTITSNKNQFYKVALRYKSGDISTFIDGVNVASSTTAFSFGAALDILSFDYNANNVLPFFGKTKALAVFPYLSDAELADLTYPTPTDPTFALNFDTIATDFTFARGSEATYVDAQGLIKSTNEIGEEEVVNGDYEQSGVGNAISQSGGILVNENNQLKITSDGSSGFSRGVWGTGGPQGQQFLIKADIISISGSTRFIDISNNAGQGLVQGTTFSTIITLGGSAPQVGFGGINDTSFELVIDNVSVKAYKTETDTPRLDYSTGAEAFLLEPQSTNLITYSEEFDNSAAWYLGNTSVVSNSVISPDGNLTADKVTFNAVANANIQRNAVPTVISGLDYTFSFYAKSDSNVSNVNIDMGTGDESIAVTTEWQRFTRTVTASGTTIPTTLVTRNSISSYIYIFGAQLEQKSYATSYIPSAGSTVTRNQETCINATPDINSEEGVLYVEMASLDTGRITISDGTLTNRITIDVNAINGVITGFVNVNNVTQYSFYESGQSVFNYNKIAIKYKENDFSVFINGTRYDVDTSGSTFATNTLTSLSFNNGVGNNSFYGKTKDVQVYTKALSDAELIKLTT